MLWVHWAIILGTLLGGLWTLSGSLAAIEQELRDSNDLQFQVNRRLERLEESLTQHAIETTPKHADH